MLMKPAFTVAPATPKLQPGVALSKLIMVPLWPVFVVYSTREGVVLVALFELQNSTTMLLVPSQSKGLAKVKMARPVIGL